MPIVLTGTAWEVPTPAAAESAKRAFDIPAGTAETALRSFAEQADTQFAYSNQNTELCENLWLHI
jgi:hypothetical protein